MKHIIEFLRHPDKVFGVLSVIAALFLMWALTYITWDAQVSVLMMFFRGPFVYLLFRK